ncbi:3-oxoacyl-[acyl-carrier-protein] synthase 3 [Methyloligella halotolerans]|uniref:Beta-ketoacyl-[acyl-carrier-protein] synthase III n=1 Tax=Methyloligella halotolerans TaxID=1177755 RepID=A0A1E2S2J8_9HYPH|nr:beta-ketoacyl-ACP synthase III [Methyloligella halotolerans]ODA68565.1 3-oxoacyl-[acyl-carrier-protein] synthase 3 [Methyloligella halotolerans]
MSVLRTVVRGCGGYLPERIMTNAEISELVETSDEWIASRTGIHERRIAGEGEYTSTMGLEAAKAALANAGMEASDIDLIVLATSTPDQTFPATATTIQAELGITKGAAFDIQAVCSGFVYALATADNFLRAGPYKRALVIGSEAFSRILDWEDRNTCVLFGDGAGAVVVEAELQPGTSTDRGILAACLRADGRYRDKLYVDGGPSTTGTTGYLRMDGPEVFRHAVIKIAEAIDEALEMAGLEPSDIDWFVPHQANKRILDGAARRLKLPPEKIVVTIDKHANTSAASIPLALNVAVQDGRIQPGDLVLMEAMGGGFTWGALLVRW